MAFVGTVTPKLLGNKVTQIVMVDPIFEVIEHTRCVGGFHIECIVIALGQLRHNWVHILEKNLPEPMSSLAAGILLGIQGKMPEAFHQSLISTGTLHIVAASGYNVTIVAVVLMSIVGRVIAKQYAIMIGILGIITYVLLAGSSASVVRAGIMGSLTLIAYYFGRVAEAKRLLWICGVIMILVNPLMIVDIGFQLSFVATAGLLYIKPWIARYGSKNKFFDEYLYPTLAATLATMPIILIQFGRVSWISPIVNMLILPVVPLIMLLTTITIGIGSLSVLLGQLGSLILYFPLWYMVKIIEMFG